MSRSIEIIQKSGANALVYGNDSEYPGEHVEVFSGPDALEKAQEWRLDEPLEPAREYEIPEHVTRMDTSLAAQDAAAAPAAFLGTLEHVAMWQKRLAKAQALEAAALDVLAHWARTLAEVTKVREATEKRLRAAQRAQEGPQGGFAGASAGTGVSEPQRSAQRASEAVAGVPAGWPSLADAEDRARRAPVNAVDIRTESVQDEGMTNTKPQLSESAQSALLTAVASRVGAPVRASIATMLELRAAGLIGTDRTTGQGRGLTERGAIVRERLITAKLDAAFGQL